MLQRIFISFIIALYSSFVCSWTPILQRRVYNNVVSRLQTKMTSETVSKRLQHTEQPYIEDILDHYSYMSDKLINLALGSSHWNPPESAIAAVQTEVFARNNHRYGNILGMSELRQGLLKQLQHASKGTFDLDSVDIAITSGANQAFANVALALCDAQDQAILLAPYYFSHLLSLQLAQAQVTISTFDATTIKPNWEELEHQFVKCKPKVIVLTSPNNPSGVVWQEDDYIHLVALCKQHNTWLVVDQTYYEFLYDDTKHVFPCSSRFQYDKIIHIFSLSKVFGLAGWRVGYVVYPKQLSDSMRKLQDTIPTHTTIFSQKLAVKCLETYDASHPSTQNNLWFQNHLQSLDQVRKVLWPVVQPLGTVYTTGAFYFLVPVPVHVDEREAVDILAKEFGVLLMPGSPFGARNHLRLSYGSIPPEQVLEAVDKLRRGFQKLQAISQSRS